MGRVKLTQEQFIINCRNKHGDYYDYSKTIYNCTRDKIIITCKIHGDFLTIAGNHSNRGNGCPKCGVLKVISKRTKPKEKFIQQAKLIYGESCDYTNSIYKNTHTSIIIKCIKHGEFKIMPYQHLQYQKGCKECKIEALIERQTMGIDEFISRSMIVHNDFYDYSKFIYKKWDTKGIIICPIHGEFTTTPHIHLKGHDCRKCSNEKAQRNGWSKTNWINSCKNKEAFIYIVELWNDVESFIKVGITGKVTTKYRLTQISKTYNYKILLEYKNIPEKIYDLENLIKRTFRKKFKYSPKLEFAGQYECYKKKIFTKIKKLINEK